MKRWLKVRFAGEVALFRLGLWLIPRCPRRFVCWLAWGAGGVAYAVARRDRRIALANLRLAFGDRLAPHERAAIARRSFRTFAQALLDFFWFSRDSRARQDRYVTVDEATYGPWMRPVSAVFVTAHFGNWELQGQFGACHGIPLASVAKPIANRRLDALLIQVREQTGQRIIPRPGALKAMLRTLRDGGKVALLLDQDTRVSEGGVFVDYFGVPVPISTAAAALALKMNAPIVPAFCELQPDGTYRVLLRPALSAEEVHRLTPEQITQWIARTVETEVRRNPGQWLWMYKRWKRKQPGADPALYPFYADC